MDTDVLRHAILSGPVGDTREGCLCLVKQLEGVLNVPVTEEPVQKVRNIETDIKPCWCTMYLRNTNKDWVDNGVVTVEVSLSEML